LDRLRRNSLADRSNVVPPFHWTTFDVRRFLPQDWERQILDVSKRYSQRRVLLTSHSTSREERVDARLALRTVDGYRIAEELPWLRGLYDTTFRCLAQLTVNEQVSVMEDKRFALSLTIHTAPDRYECHVDTNPLEAILYVTSHHEDSGGELVV